jgi:site-specific DNA recombinase
LIDGIGQFRFRGIYTAPIGYKNRVTEDGRKYITPYEPNASIMKWAFEQLAEGDRVIAEILRECRKKGLRCSKNNFWVAMRNPVYCGKIFIPKYKDEEACFVQGQHEAIISEELFNEAQNVMNGRKKKTPFKIASPKELPLRGFPLCPRCGRNLTGSPSKGKTKWHFYYHCLSACGYRVNALKLNDEFVAYLKKFSPLVPENEAYMLILENRYRMMTKGSGSQKKELLSEMKELEGKISKIRQLLVDGDIEAEDYRATKKDYDTKISELEEKLNEIAKRPNNVPDLLKKLMNTLVDVDMFYLDSNVEVQRQIISTFYPFKMVFENQVCRTPRVNEGG